MPSADTLLRTIGLRKSYAGPVLLDVELELRRGEVHALVGENGAGKSTLSRILAGLTRPDSGEMTLGGAPFVPATRREAEQRGVRMVMQELNLIGNLSVAENLFLDQLPHRLGWIDSRRLREQARAVLEQVGLKGIDPDQPVSCLGVGRQQLVEIAAGLARPCALLILDEPTAALTDPEIDRLFELIAGRRAAGTGVLYISHRLEEIRRISDRISVLRDGRLIATRATAETPLDEIVRLMVGRDLGEAVERQSPEPGPVALRVEGLRRGAAVRDVSFEVRRGEILGFAGLMGSGRTETLRAVFGADRKEAGEIFLHGSSTPTPLRSPRDAVRHGVALLTEDRKQQGLWLPLPIRTNLTLPALKGLSRAGGWIRARAERAEASRWAATLSLRYASLEQRVAELSGGNQQKVIVARWLSRDCDILLFDEPTRGIDVGARFEIYQLLGGLARQGKAIVVASSDLKELLALCDRIAVMSAGRLAATFQRGEWTQDGLMAAALSGYLQPGSATNPRTGIQP